MLTQEWTQPEKFFETLNFDSKAREDLNEIKPNLFCNLTLICLKLCAIFDKIGADLCPERGSKYFVEWLIFCYISDRLTLFTSGFIEHEEDSQCSVSTE